MDKLHLSIMFEPTDNCNYKCWMCPRQGNSDVHNTGIPSANRFMDMQLFEKIMNNLSKMERIELDTIFFHWIGEPFLHPLYLKMISRIALLYSSGQLKFKALETHTNGSILTPELIDEMFDSFDDSFPWILSFSLDAITERSYSKIRTGKKIMKVFEAISNIIKKRTELGFTWPKIITQFIVQDENNSETEKFFRYWKTFFHVRGLEYDVQFQFNHNVPRDTIFFRTLDYGSPDEQKENIELVNDLQKRLFENKKKENVKNSDKSKETCTEKLCVCMWQSCAIRWDGNMNFICDIENSMPLGNLSEAGFEEIFFGKNAQKYRGIQMSGNHDQIDKCRLCGAYLSPNSGLIDESVRSFFTP